jgi:hypothetical protein
MLDPIVDRSIQWTIRLLGTDCAVCGQPAVMLTVFAYHRAVSHLSSPHFCILPNVLPTDPAEHYTPLQRRA